MKRKFLLGAIEIGAILLGVAAQTITKAMDERKLDAMVEEKVKEALKKH